MAESEFGLNPQVMLVIQNLTIDQLSVMTLPKSALGIENLCRMSVSEALRDGLIPQQSGGSKAQRIREAAKKKREQQEKVARKAKKRQRRDRERDNG
jgi:hypothetical protein